MAEEQPVNRRFIMPGYAIVVIAFACLSALFIYYYKSNIEASGVNNKHIWIIWIICVFFLALIVYLSDFSQRKNAKKAQQQFAPQQVVNNKSLLQEQKKTVRKYSDALQHMRHVLRHRYGRFWKKRLTILIIAGNIRNVENLAPGLSSQL